MFGEINEFLNENEVVRMIIDGFLAFLFITMVLSFIFRNKKALSFVIPFLLVVLFWYLSKELKLNISSKIYTYVLGILPIFAIVILTPEIRKDLEYRFRVENSREVAASSNEETKKSISEAVMFLSSRKTGALITIEKHNSLDQYAEKAIQMNSDVSKELLINIFSPLTPLHDGAVIIRGNKIRCAGAYFVLTQESDLEKTMGSRHRAGLGISEVSDALTIIVSEETGNISITIEGIMLKINTQEKLIEYLNMFIK